MDRIDTTIVVNTPERVGFRYRAAGPAARGAAWGIDFLLQGFIGAGLSVIAGLSGFAIGQASMGIMLVGLFALTWFYSAAFELWASGRTPGKMVVGIRVVKRDGASIGPREAVLRNLVRAVDGLPMLYVIGVIVVAVDSAGRRLGDLVADTVVISERSTKLLGDVAIDPPVSDEERRMMPTRVTLSSRERRVIEELLRRRARHHPDFLENLASELAPKLARREGLEAPTHVRTLELAYARATGKDA